MENTVWHRRKFIASMVGASALTLTSKRSYGKNVPGLTIQQVIDLIVKQVPGGLPPQTVDTVKTGDAQQQVKAIVTTMFATIPVIEAAAKAGANFIIVHEPLFYNHADSTSWLEHDEVYAYKSALLKKYNMVVWRFHDGIHTLLPDGVLMGVLEAMGWEKLYKAEMPYFIKSPVSSLGQIIDDLKKKLNIRHLKFIGDRAQRCETIAIAPGAAGGKKQIGAIAALKPDVLICGEVNEWETSEYVRDLQAMGGKTSLVVLGHILSEEPGSEWLAHWLKPQLNNIPVIHIPSQEIFTWG